MTRQIGQESPPNVAPPPTTDRIPAPPPRPADVWPHRRMVDQVRSTALFNAVEVATGVFSATALQDAVIAGWIISLAKEFEDYLTGGGEQP